MASWSLYKASGIRRDNPQSASDCYLPISFAKHIKITADKAHGQYYHFNCLLLPPKQSVASFHLPLSETEQAALMAVADAWGHPGRDPKPRLADQTTLSAKVVLKPGESLELASLNGPGVVRAVKARVNSEQRYAWRKLVIEATWDGAANPQVASPLGPCFGFDWDTAEYGSVPAGCLHGQAYQYFPLPFRKSAKFRLQSYLEMPANAELEIEWAPIPSLPSDIAYFYARWRHEPDSKTFDYAFLETAGRGHFVGVSMPIDHPFEGWWGEGDEKVWVDDDDFPPFVGTGSEDYFGDAWGIRYLSGPSYGASSFKGHRTCNYRWHFADLIPFEKRMRMTIENYGPNGQGPQGQYDYSSTAFWYQAEPAPDFESLRGVNFTGGTGPEAKPSRMKYNPALFAKIDAENIRTYGLGITFATQGEELFKEAVQQGNARIITDAKLAYEFDRERAVQFGEVKAGAKLAEARLNMQRPVYTSHASTQHRVRESRS
jgi:hypothetical protein